MAKKTLFPSRLLPVGKPARTVREEASAQAEMPVSFRSSGKRTAALSEHMNASVATLGLDELTDEQWRALASRRIAARTDLRLVTSKNRLLGPRAAAKEVRNGTPIGKALLEIEKAVVRELVAEAQLRPEQFTEQQEKPSRKSEKSK